MSTPAAAEWETVYTVNDYFDGPRGGVADYLGKPHVYKCDWNDAADDWSELFSLSPIGSATFRLVQEDWQIWRRWKSAFDRGQLAEGDQHPALAIDRTRHEEIRAVLTTALQIDAANAIRAIPEFRGSLEPLALEVRWSQI
jgi:hypothetical protein